MLARKYVQIGYIRDDSLQSRTVVRVCCSLPLLTRLNREGRFLGQRIVLLDIYQVLDATTITKRINHSVFIRLTLFIFISRVQLRRRSIRLLSCLWLFILACFQS